MQKVKCIIISTVMLFNFIHTSYNGCCWEAQNYNNGTVVDYYNLYSSVEVASDTDGLADENTKDIISEDINITSKSAILLEADSGKILYSKNETEQLKPASVTKIMTVLLCFDKIKSGDIKYDDIITISEHAASMGGSQCFFEAGETQTVYDIMKCIQISSGNDAAVAMGEHIAGSEEQFVNLMNTKAKELGMNNTNFENACGLDSDNHYTCALDIGIMSRELITKHPEIFEISTIWMDHITHKTNKGESRFDLANTNKFLRQYTGANGLKTGYTSEAGYCMSGTATRDGITLIAVIMGADSKETRNNEVARLLDYGFSKSAQYTDASALDADVLFEVKGGTKDYVVPKVINEHSFTVFDVNPQNIKKKIKHDKKIVAPIKKGDIIGEVIYYFDEEIISSVPIVASESIPKKTYSFSIRDLCNRYFVVE